ncbi:MAG: hypothetical protein H6643_07220 [Caldilineaceae bacterium]|nr:hypothetical protein [Caldilineaceae bacterium]
MPEDDQGGREDLVRPWPIAEPHLVSAAAPRPRKRERRRAEDGYGNAQRALHHQRRERGEDVAEEDAPRTAR